MLRDTPATDCAGKPNIRHQHISDPLTAEVERLLAGRGLNHVEPSLLQGFGRHLTDEMVVFHDENCQRHLNHPPQRPRIDCPIDPVWNAGGTILGTNEAVARFAVLFPGGAPDG